MYANNKMLFYWAYTVRNNYILIKLKYKVLSFCDVKLQILWSYTKRWAAMLCRMCVQKVKC